MLVNKTTAMLMMKKMMLATAALAFLMPLLSCANDEVSIVKDSDKQENARPQPYTVTGRVTCSGKPLAGVAVSDGVDVVVTDAAGEYRLNSSKELGYVFVSTPGGYGVATDGNRPQFFRRLSSLKTNEVETADFELRKEDNEKHAVFTLADAHLAARNNDVQEFRKAAADINATVRNLRGQGYKVYGISLGDESWDLYWQTNHYNIMDARDEMNVIEAPLYHNMGNHDGNPYVAGDRKSEQSFIDACGPTYYSFNLGKVHYVVLDNIEYLNDGAKEGVLGKRNYHEKIVDTQMKWLRKDFALIKDNATPIVIAMHSPVYRHPQLLNGEQTLVYLMSNGSELESLLSRFDNVHTLSGHLHTSHNIQSTPNIFEHNTPAISATWWWTDKLVGKSVCLDGSPGGYGVYRWDGTTADWYYKGLFLDESCQFRAYDLNTTYINPQSYAPDYVEDMTRYAHEYATPRHDNRVLINVWNYDSAWKVEVFEDNKPLAVTRVMAYDPMHIIAYDAPRIKAGGAAKVSFATIQTSHMFAAQATRSNSTLRIKVTDRFGRVYTEDMVRPKAFGIDMK